MKLFIKIFIGFVVVCAVLFLARNIIIKTAIESSSASVLGMQVSVDSINVGFPESVIEVYGLQVHNPEGFGDDMMVNVPVFKVDYNLAEIIKGNVDINEFKLHVKEMVVVKNKENQLNINQLKPLKEQEKSTDKKVETKDKSEVKKDMSFRVGKLFLQIDEVSYVTHSMVGDPNVQKFKINLKEEVDDITDPAAFVRYITMKAVTSTTIAQLTGFDIKGLSGTLTNTMTSTVSGVGEEAVTKTKETLKGLTDGLKGLPGF